jgi:predicted hydrocarbon binding protein
MDLFEKFMLARQLNFSDGKIELLGQYVLFLPSDFLAMYTESVNSNPELVKSLYEAAKRTVREGFGVNVGKSYGFSPRDYTNWFKDILKLSGWGDAYWEENDLENHKGVISIKGSTVAAYLKGKVSSPCDHIVRGFMAGGGSNTYNSDIDVIEIECEAIGAERCKFIVDSAENLKIKFPNLSKQQLSK